YGEKGEDTGGGGEKMFAASPALSEVELRKDFKSTAYWNPSIETDDEGVASVTFDLPANLTTFRVMAVAQTAASDFGRGEDLIRVSKSLQLQPSLPRFARAGDEFEGGVVARNLSDKPGTVTLSLDTEGIRCSDSAPRTFNLEAGEAREVLFAFKAELPGRAGLAFRARMGDETDGLEIVLPVHLPRALETVAFSGQTDGAVREFVRIPGDTFAEEGRLDVQASPTALGGLKGSLDYLENYPYLCLEQRLSRLLPYLAASNVIFDFHLSPMDAAAARKTVQTGLRDIYEYQTDEGAFGAWTDSSRASPFLSAYAVFALIKAREAGYEVDSSRLETAVAYLKNLLREEPEAGPGPYGALSRNTTMAFIAYDLALLGQPEPAYMERLFKDRQNLSLFGKTMLFKSFRLAKGGARTRDLLLDELMNMIRVAPADAHFEEAEDSGLAWIYSSNLRTTAFILQALIEAGSEHPLIPQIARWIVNKRNSGHWGSTQANFYVLYALNEFYKKYEKGGADFSFGLSLDSRVLLEGSFRKIDAGAAFRSTKLADFRSGTTLPLDAHKEGAGTLSYDVRMIYAPRGKLPAADQGIAVVKRLETPAGKPVSAVRAGDLVVVALDIVVPQESLFVVVDDPLPAGFEAVNPVFATESEEALRALDGLDGGEVLWWEGFNHTEMRDERVLLFADSLKAGLHTHRYLVRALTPGAFRAPGTKVEEMYAPEVFGRGTEQDVTIEK
ncbi:MAG: alpha-2-macroglobulin family protein, partial [Candidatus Aminicenantales bacterium]